jgi:WD repeat-containing protein 68
MVLVWDLVNPTTANSAGQISSAPGQPTAGGDNIRAPAASWRCDFEVNNLSWAPPSGLTTNGQNEWLGVVGGRGVYGVKL